MKTYAYGFPRLGLNREYKNMIESFWAGKIKKERLLEIKDDLENSIIDIYRTYVDSFPVGEMTLYDKMLDTAIMLGLYRIESIDDYYMLCRGKDALEMTKWFNTNYHYLIPEIKNGSKLSIYKPEIEKIKKTLKNYPSARAYFIGPFTFLKLSKGIKKELFRYYLMEIGELYGEIVKEFESIHIDEPGLVLDLTEQDVSEFKMVYSKIGRNNPNIYVFTYYDSVDFLEKLYDLPIKGIGLDFVNGKENFNLIKERGFPEDKTLIAGIVNGKNVWKTDFNKAIDILNNLSLYVKDIVISNGSPLYHLPITIKAEKKEKPLLNRLAFAEERLNELNGLKRIITEGNIEPIRSHMDDVCNYSHMEKGVETLKERDFKRTLRYEERSELQKKYLNLPIFPSTTIGSFPQTRDIRLSRIAYKKKEISEKHYNNIIKEKVEAAIKLQEDLGLDVLVHGEFERSDMVEFFAEKLLGIETTENGWIISYGTRTYRPPIIYGDIERPNQMTVDFIKYAQSLTEKPVKGILTGPSTIITWSYIREDIPINKLAYQIALAIKKEIKDLEENNIKIIQIDEPAFREGAPLKKRDWDKYFSWAVNAFNLSISDSKPETQIHTHMCYSEFGEILEYIMKMDFDVISIEASRSRGDIIEFFKDLNFKKQIGLGIWDVHTKKITSKAKMMAIIKKALSMFSPEQLWINPDCGLKTREWKETVKNLKNMMKAVDMVRKRYKKNTFQELII